MNYMFQQQYGITSWEVLGFWFGAWDTVFEFLKPYFRSHDLATDDLVKKYILNY